jgi:hypothetical protein
MQSPSINRLSAQISQQLCVIDLRRNLRASEFNKIGKRAWESLILWDFTRIVADFRSHVYAVTPKEKYVTKLKADKAACIMNFKYAEKTQLSGKNLSPV